VNHLVVGALCAIPRPRRGLQSLTRWLILLPLTLTVISGCAYIGDLTQDLSPRHLAETLWKGTPSREQPLSKRPEQLQTLIPFAIAPGPDGNLWFSQLRKSQIGRITPAEEISTFDLGSGALAERLTAGPDDAIWFTDPAGNRIGRLGLDGTTAYVPLPTPDSGPAAIVSASDGNLWFTEHAANRVARITPLGTLTEFRLPHRGGPAGIAEGSDGKLYIAENSGNRIDQMAMDGRLREFRLPKGGGRPDGVIRAAGGDIWFTEFGAEKVGRLTATGHLLEYALIAQGPPVGIAAGPDGNIWVTVPAAHAICKLTPHGNQAAYYMRDDIMPGMIAIGSDGNLWFTQPNGRLGRLSPLGTVSEFPAIPTTRTASSWAVRHLLTSNP
jgi:virginiamycin B lyase